MKALEVTREQFDEFKKLQVKRRWDWPATFSTNSRGSIWPYVTNGRTPEYDRTDVRGVSPLLDEIADRYTALREEGGRFFIGWNGAFWRSGDDDHLHKIVCWEDMRPPIRQTSIDDLPEYLRSAFQAQQKKVENQRMN
jgi:hypothetical protein